MTPFGIVMHMLSSAEGLLLTDDPRPMRKYILWMWPISFLPTVALGFLGSIVGIDPDAADLTAEALAGAPALVVVFLLVIVSPVVETLMMSFVLFILSRFMKKKVTLAMVSAVLWGLLHGLDSPVWGVHVLWPFFVFSCAYLTWRQKSWFHAVWVTCCIHALQNLVPSLGIVILMGM